MSAFVELSSGPMLTDAEGTSVSCRCTRCVVVCEKSEVTSVEGGHDLTRH